jgi:hypothetical protein
MTYSVGSNISASDYMNFRGLYDASTPYPDNPTAINKLAALIGVGFGTRGYGQVFSFPSVTSGQTVTAMQWNLIRTVMNLINVHTGAGQSLQPTVNSGSIIIANDGTGGRPNLSSLITSFDAARLSYDIGQMQLTSELTSTRTTSWNTEVYHEFTVDFSNENPARYFFNTGGTVYASASRTGGSATAINTAMTNLLNQMGTIKFGSQATTYTGSGGTVYPIGYYNLTGSYQTLFYHNGPGGYYSPLTYTLQARVENYVGINGANGSLIRFKAIFDTGLSALETLDGTLTSSISQIKENGGLSVLSPVYTTTSSL